MVELLLLIGPQALFDDIYDVFPVTIGHGLGLQKLLQTKKVCIYGYDTSLTAPFVMVDIGTAATY